MLNKYMYALKQHRSSCLSSILRRHTAAFRGIHFVFRSILVFGRDENAEVNVPREA